MDTLQGLGASQRSSPPEGLKHRFATLVKEPFKGLFLDVAYVIDSVWRRLEFEANRLFDFKLSYAEPRRVPEWRTPAFWLFLLTATFVAFGPTFDAICSALGLPLVERLRLAAVPGAVLVGCAQWWITSRYIMHRFRKRMARVGPAVTTLRSFTAGALILIGTFALALPWGALASYLAHHTASESCTSNSSLWSWSVIAAPVVAGVLYALLSRHDASRIRRLVLQLILLSAFVLLLHWSDAKGTKEADQLPYLHVFAYVALALGAIALLSHALIWLPFRSLEDAELQQWPHALQRVELFPGPRKDPVLKERRILASLALGILQHPLHLLLLPAFFIVISPSQWLMLTTGLSVGVSALLLTIGNLTHRWRFMIAYVDRWFLSGTPLVVSIVVIVLAVLRLARIHYVATVLDVAPFGVLFFWMVMAYVLFWWFEGHVNTVLGARLLALLEGERSIGERLYVKYAPTADCPNPHGTTVDPTPRWVSYHGLGRFLVVGWFTPSEAAKVPLGEPIPAKERAFFTYGIVELLEQLRGRDNEAVHDLARRVHLYFATLNVFLLIGGGVFMWLYGQADDNNTVVPILQAQRSQGTVDLAQLLAAVPGNDRPALVIAASGGGTRAAMYTEAALEALENMGQAENIVLLSGVSGGGVAAAYFYEEMNALVSSDRKIRQLAWDGYRKRMAEPFITDVLEGASEWRIFKNAPLSVLLAESFERRLFDSRAPTLGAHTRAGLILNTTLTGHPLAYTDLLGKSFTSAQVPKNAPCALRTRPLSNLSGGRLALTNLRDVPVEQKLEGLPDVRMPFIAIADPALKLSAVSALTANFPPIFPNARVDIVKAGSEECPDSFFVTDGGAMENLGLLPALMAIHTALTHTRGDQPIPAAIRDIHIVALEASAFDFDYSQDRGVSAATGGSKERLTAGLTLLMIDKVNEVLQAKYGKRLHVHYLPLPTVFRARGGFGTHWMAPPSITLNNPRTLYASDDCGSAGCSVTLSRKKVEALWKEMFDPKTPFCRPASNTAATRPASKVDAVKRWICGDESSGESLDLTRDYFVNAWQQLRNDLPDRSQSPGALSLASAEAAQ